MLLILNQPMQDGGNSSTSRMVMLSTKRVRFLMLEVDKTEITKMLLSGTYTMD